MTNKISFHEVHGPDAVYRQTVSVDMDTFHDLALAVKREIAEGLPNKKRYVRTSGYEIFLKPILLEASSGRVWLNHTQRDFINTILGLPLKDRNTCLKVRGLA